MESAAYCTPSVERIQTPLPRSIQKHAERPDSQLLFITFGYEQCELPLSPARQCWHALFSNPVIVRGFPIPRWSEPAGTGLEMPLNMMMSLARAVYIIFKSKVFIKGFPTMLVPTKRSADVMVWHLFSEPTREVHQSQFPSSSKTTKTTYIVAHRPRSVSASKRRLPTRHHVGLDLYSSLPLCLLQGLRPS